MSNEAFESRLDDQFRDGLGELVHHGKSVVDATETATEQLDQRVCAMGAELRKRELSAAEMDELRDQLERVQSDLVNRLDDLESASLVSKERLRTKVNVALGHLTDLLSQAESRINAMYPESREGTEA